MTARALPARPHLPQLKRQAKELLRQQPQVGRLRDAQRLLAAEYGFASWDALRTHVESIVGAVSRSILKPPELESEDGGPVWDTLTASDDGDVEALRHLVDRDPRLSRAEYWYTPAIHFAVREGHRDAVALLLDAGADPEWNGLYDGSLIVLARDRGHADIAALLEETRNRRGRILAGSDHHPLHAAISRDDTREVRRLLDADPSLVDVGNEIGASPLHRAVGRGVQKIAALLLERGANVHAIVSAARGLGGGFWTDLQAIDLAIWHGRHAGDRKMIAVLLAHGATHDLTVAAALGDLDRVRQMLDAEPQRIQETRPSGRRPLGAAIEAGHDAVARLLLERGADPNWSEPTAPKGRALHAAASAGNRAIVDLLLALDAGADLSARDEEYRSTPLAWAARAGAVEMVKFLLSRGAPISLPDDEPWATPLAWAERRQHATIVTILRRHSDRKPVIGSP